MRRLLAIALLSAITLPAAGQEAAPDADGATRLGERLRDEIMPTTSACQPGRLVVRPHITGGEASALLMRLILPTLEALRESGRFNAVHIAGFEGADAEGAARSHRLGYDTLVDIVVARAGPRMAVVASTWSTDPAVRHAVSRISEPLDISLRQPFGFPAPVTEATITARAGRLPGRGYLAIAVHDFDGDGVGEIVVARREGVEIVRVAERGAAGLTVSEVGQARWPSIGRAAAPPRRLVGTMTSIVDEGHGSVIVRLSDHAGPIAVTSTGSGFTAALANGPCAPDRFPFGTRCAALVDGRDFFDRRLVREGEEDRDAGPHFYVYRELDYRTRNQGHAEFVATVSPSGRIAVRVVRRLQTADSEQIEEREHARSAPGYGTALAMTDFDLDGSAELLASTAAPEGETDRLVVLRAFHRGALHAFWQSDPLDGSVWVACSGDTDGDGFEELLAIEEPVRGRARLWIVR